MARFFKVRRLITPNVHGIQLILIKKLSYFNIFIVYHLRVRVRRGTHREALPYLRLPSLSAAAHVGPPKPDGRNRFISDR